MNSKDKEAPINRENLRKFNVYVNGEHFEVMVEEVGGSPVVRHVRSGPATGPQQQGPIASESITPQTPSSSAQSPLLVEPAASTQPKVEGVPLIAPMPGTIINFEKQLGDKVQEGETVVILEAMKMENALPAPASGVIRAINFKSGDAVARGDVLCIIG